MPGQVRFRRRFQEALVQSQVRFNRVPEKVPEKVWKALAQRVRFNRDPEKVLEKVGFPALGFAARFRKICKTKTLPLLGLPLKLVGFTIGFGYVLLHCFSTWLWQLTQVDDWGKFRSGIIAFKITLLPSHGGHFFRAIHRRNSMDEERLYWFALDTDRLRYMWAPGSLDWFKGKITGNNNHS